MIVEPVESKKSFKSAQGHLMNFGESGQVLDESYNMMHLCPRKLQAFDDTLHIGNSGMVKQNSRRKVWLRTLRQQFKRLPDMIRPLEFRNDLCTQAAFLEHSKTAGRLAFGQNPRQFFSNALAAHLMNFRRHRANGIPRCRLDRVTQPSAESNSPEDPQFVLFEARVRIADGPNDLGLDI